jgi:carbon monoxide dehydrogenase subunit G
VDGTGNFRNEEDKRTMEVSGNQKVNAPRPQVFNALLDPDTLKNSVPGCDSAEFVDFPTGRQLKLTVSPNFPGLKGPYNVFLQNGTQSLAASLPPVADPWSRIVYIAEPTSSFGSIKATCIITLADDPEGTMLSYEAQAEIEGKIAATPDFIMKKAVKAALDQFFKNFEKQVSTVNV